MAYRIKAWKNRISEFPNRRRLDSTGIADTYDVIRSEGVVSVEGNKFDDVEMNDLEARIAAEFKEQSTGLVTPEEKQAIANAVPNTRKVNGHALTGDIVVTKTDLGLDLVNNTADSTKSVNYANSAGSAPANGGNSNTVGGWSFEAAGTDPTATLPPGRVHFTY